MHLYPSMKRFLCQNKPKVKKKKRYKAKHMFRITLPAIILSV